MDGGEGVGGKKATAGTERTVGEGCPALLWPATDPGTDAGTAGSETLMVEPSASSGEASTACCPYGDPNTGGSILIVDAGVALLGAAGTPELTVSGGRRRRTGVPSGVTEDVEYGESDAAPDAASWWESGK